MNELVLAITINRPVEEVFAFALNPKNTPKWVNFIEYEETNEWPAKLGTIYRNHGSDKEAWSTFEVTLFEPNKAFVLSKKDTDYYVRYVFTPKSKDTTELTYYEWMGNLELTEPQMLEKLKQTIESDNK
jgi:uncharacterized protein YndB with AHSA1/START domain